MAFIRRKIPVRGRLAIEALYFLTERDAKMSADRRGQLMQGTSKDRSGIPEAEETHMELPIPCPPDVEGAAACEASPPIMAAEHIKVPL